MVAATAAAYVVAAAAVAGAYEQRKGAKTAARQTKKAAQADNVRESLRTQRQRQKLIAQLRMQQAAQASQAANTGTQQTSSLFGAQTSTLSQAGSTSVFGGVQSGLAQLSAMRQGKAASAINSSNAKAGIYAGIGAAASPFANPELSARVFGTEQNG
jgi:hypothetical protein